MPETGIIRKPSYIDPFTTSTTKIITFSCFLLTVTAAWPLSAAGSGIRELALTLYVVPTFLTG